MKKIAKYMSVSLAMVSMPLVAFGAVDLTRDSITTILDNFKTWAAGIIGILGILIMLYAAFAYMTAGGDEEKVGSAKRILMYGLVGVGIALIAFGVFGLVESFLS